MRACVQSVYVSIERYKTYSHIYINVNNGNYRIK